MHIEALRALRVGCRHNKSAICALFLAHKNSRKTHSAVRDRVTIDDRDM